MKPRCISRDHMAAAMSVVATEARLTECIVREGSSFPGELFHQLNRIERSLAKARRLCSRYKEKR